MRLNVRRAIEPGLKTLVNVTPALAHHTVAIDRKLPLPGPLILDGVSANSSREGLDGNRILDMYRLFAEVFEEFGEHLQVIVVDNEIPSEVSEAHADRIVLSLSQEDRLIRLPTEGHQQDGGLSCRWRTGVQRSRGSGRCVQAFDVCRGCPRGSARAAISLAVATVR